MPIKESGAFYYTDIFGETQYVVFAPVEVNDWYTFQIVSGTNLLADQQMLNKIARDTMGKYFLLNLSVLSRYHLYLAADRKRPLKTDQTRR